MYSIAIALTIYLNGYCSAWCLDREYSGGKAYQKGCRCYDEFEEDVTRAAILARGTWRNAGSSQLPSASIDSKDTVIDFNNYKSDYYTRKYSED